MFLSRATEAEYPICQFDVGLIYPDSPTIPSLKSLRYFSDKIFNLLELEEPLLRTETVLKDQIDIKLQNVNFSYGNKNRNRNYQQKL